MVPVLQVENLSISFTQYTSGLRRRTISAVRGLNLAVEAGQVVAVVGASGSGKSLLAHSILGLLPYNSRMEGRIVYQGAPLTIDRLKQLRGREIVLAPQGVSYLDPLMQVDKQLRRGRRDAQARADSRAALARYGLGPDTGRKYPFELSGGMARRVIMAAAAMEQPRLLIADEPTPGMDAPAARRLLGHFRALAAEQTAVLFITHALDLAIEVADRVVVLYAGQTIEEAATEDFQSVHRLRHPYTRALWRAMPQHDFAPLPGAQPGPGQAESGCPFAPRCPKARAACGQTVPYRPFGGGWVRCLYAEEGDA